MNTKIPTKNWFKLLCAFAKTCTLKMLLSMLFSVLSVAGGFIPYLCLYQIVQLFIFGNPQMEVFLLWCAMCLLGYLVQIVFFALSTVFSHSAAYHILHELRMGIANRLMKAPLGNVTGKTIGNLKNTMLEKVEGIERPLAHLIPELGANIILTLLIFGYLFVIDWRMGLASMVTIPFAAIPMLITMKSFNKKYAAYMRANDSVNSVIIEYVEGIEVVKTFNQSTSSYEKFTKGIYDFQKFILDWFESSWKPMNLVLSILPTTFLGTLPIGLILYKLAIITPTELTMCLILSLSLIPSLLKATSYINEMKSMQYNVNGAMELLDMDILSEASSMPEIKNYDIALDSVLFSYSGNELDTVLHSISLQIAEGSFIALVGPSGGGKSTLAKLISRFWDVQDGTIKIGGVNIKDMLLNELSTIVSFVTQDNFLFNCTLQENIRLGNPHATDEEVYEAARNAHCDEFIRNLENGYDTLAGEAGKCLSGGEKQRIAIARCILKDAPIVILDEATAFTDPQNEDKIQKSIIALTKGKTLVVIAHRLSTIKNADKIVLLEKGHIVATGTHTELLDNSSLYSEMWQAHIGAKNWAVAKMHGKGKGNVNEKGTKND